MDALRHPKSKFLLRRLSERLPWTIKLYIHGAAIWKQLSAVYYDFRQQNELIIIRRQPTNKCNGARKPASNIPKVMI